jgi:hypothetical protein
MNQLINPNDIHTAAATWSGFIYQGKVALYQVLHLLNTDANALNFSLQLDSLEDFAIVDADINPITLHQVKAMKSNLYSAYKDAFDKLEQRLVTFPCNGAYFHISTQNEKTIEEIKELHPTIDIYTYGVNPFCQLRDINRVCEEQIALYLNNNQLQHHNNANNVTALRNSLESIICTQIINIHANNHSNNGSTIREGAYYSLTSLQIFYDLLTSDPTTILNEDYFLFLSKELINHYYLEFCHEIEDERIITEEEKNKLAIYLMQINGLNKASLIKFIQSILPHREVKLNSILDFKDYNIQNEEFKDAFLQILHELSASDGEIGSNFTWKGADNLTYTATAINNPEQGKKRVCKRIFENITQIDIEVPYESDKLITTALEVESIEKELNHQTQVDENLNNVNNITRWSKISLTTLENAKKNIK